MPRSVYWPLLHISHSPTAQFAQGTGSGRRTMPTTRSPFFKRPEGSGSNTRPSDSCPSTSRSLPAGGQPYLPSAISTSVPQTPTATASTSTEPSQRSGSGTSSRRAVPGFPGSTVIAFMVRSFLRAAMGVVDSGGDHRVFGLRVIRPHVFVGVPGVLPTGPIDKESECVFLAGFKLEFQREITIFQPHHRMPIQGPIVKAPGQHDAFCVRGCFSRQPESHGALGVVAGVFTADRPMIVSFRCRMFSSVMLLHKWSSFIKAFRPSIASSLRQRDDRPAGARTTDRVRAHGRPPCDPADDVG